jgi:amino acid transporter
MQHFDEPQTPSGPAMAPPTDYQEPFLQPQSSNWPKIIGIIAIVFGAVASLFGVLGLLAQLMVDKLAEVVPDEQKEAMTASMQNQGMNILSTVLQLGAAVLLIVGGVKLLGRKRSGVSICRAWAVLKILVVILASVISYSAVKAQMEMIQNDPELANAQMPQGFFDAAAGFGMACGALWGFALPVFMLIWFSRGKIKHEVAEWSE